MENMTVLAPASIMELVDFTIRVANFMEWYFLVWGCIGWAAALAIYYHHIKSGGKQWI